MNFLEFAIIFLLVGLAGAALFAFGLAKIFASTYRRHEEKKD